MQKSRSSDCSGLSAYRLARAALGMIRSGPVWQAKGDLLREVPGVAPNLARTLILVDGEPSTVMGRLVAA